MFLVYSVNLQRQEKDCITVVDAGAIFLIGDRYPGRTPLYSPKARAVAQRHNLPPKRRESSRGSIKGGWYADITAGIGGGGAKDPGNPNKSPSATTLRGQTTINHRPYPQGEGGKK